VQRHYKADKEGILADRRSETGTVAFLADTRSTGGTPARGTAAGHYLLLDALRGVAAVAVLCLHWCEGLGNSWFNGAHLAVDFFFLLSGFVMDHAYADRLRQGLGFGRFFLLRVIRLWPMIAAGAVVGLVRETMRATIGHDPDASLAAASYRFVLNLFLVPDVWSGLDAAKFPLNIAMWSLFAEFAAYSLFGLFSYRAGTWTLAAVAAISGVAVAVWLAIYYDPSSNAPYFSGLSYVFDIGRAIFPFTLGMLLYRLRDRLPKLHLQPVASMAILAGVLILPQSLVGLPVRIGLLIGFFPLLVLASARTQLGGWTAKLATLLGDLSYPLYAIHTPLIWLIGAVLGVIATKAHIALPKIALGVVVLPATVAFAYFLLRFYDEPLRRYFGRLYRRSEPSKTAP
jgi:peptidoglycan/LPS O-acetylase OafA/YrhL